MTTWTQDKKWSDKFLPVIKSILGQVLFRTAPQIEDAKRNTDLLVLRAGDIRVACRVRRHQYLASYGHEFTLRASRASGAKTELSKVLDGWGDYMIYAFADEAETGLAQWVLGDLKVFRQWLAAQMGQPGGPWQPWDFGDHQMNSDRGSGFVAYGWDHVGAGSMVVAAGYDAVDVPAIHWQSETAGTQQVAP